jgi:transcriptional regulator with GAF, ATPase, and Fis domain
MGRRIEPLSEQCQRRLAAYSWPGNVRELQNVIERAVIISQDGRLNLDRALPDDQTTAGLAPAARPDRRKSSDAILRRHEFEQFERANIVRALEASGWRVSGKDGAAALLGINPSTLNSRLRALKIQKNPR